MAPKGSERFPKSARLRKRTEFVQLARYGSKVHSGHFVVIVQSNEAKESRLGITVSAKVGNSVVRNRIKRQVREYFRRHRAKLPKATDFLVIARSTAATLASELIAREIERAMAPGRA